MGGSVWCVQDDTGEEQVLLNVDRYYDQPELRFTSTIKEGGGDYVEVVPSELDRRIRCVGFAENWKRHPKVISSYYDIQSYCPEKVGVGP